MAAVFQGISGVASTDRNAGGAGFGYRGEQANIMHPVTQGQVDQGYTNAQTGIDNQANFLAAVQAQNGLANQSQVFNQQQGIVNGTGPNPAQAQLAQATGANVANQAALMAGQRGSSANVGQIARQAGQQGAQIQQQAAGQAATLQANQSLNALNQMGQIATNQANQQANATNAYTGAAQGEQGQLLGSVNAENQARVGSQTSINSGQAQLANTAATGQSSVFGGVAGAVGSLGNLFAEGGAVGAQPTQRFANGTTEIQQVKPSGPQSRVGQMFAGMQQGANSMAPQQHQQDPGMSGVAQGYQVGQGLIKAGKAAYNGINSYFNAPTQAPYGSQPGDLANKGQWTDTTNAPAADAYSSPGMIAEGSAGEVAGGAGDIGAAAQGAEAIQAEEGAQLAAAADATEAAEIGQVATLAAAKGGKVPALVSPGEHYVPPKDMKKVRHGANPLSVGERIPGKPKFAGNNYANDTVPRNLDKGGVVIPNSIMEQPKSTRDKKAEAFVRQYLAKGGKVNGMVVFSSKRKK